VRLCLKKTKNKKPQKIPNKRTPEGVGAGGRNDPNLVCTYE
jgi:hypothetical protein